jgi:hypothetical protein
MSSSSADPPTGSTSTHEAWSSLVSRSIAAWDKLSIDEQSPPKNMPTSMSQNCHSLDDFLAQSGNPLMLWFFQRRSAFISQKRMKKWSSNDLDDYVLLPALKGLWRRFRPRKNHNLFRHSSRYYRIMSLVRHRRSIYSDGMWISQEDINGSSPCWQNRCMKDHQTQA